MTLDEAIKHCVDIAESCEWEARRCDETDRYECHVMHELGKCAAEHRKLAEWLAELKERRAADVQPVKHGRWEEIHISLCKWIPEDEKEEGHSFYMAELKCSCCERYNAVTFALTLNKPDFCQLCGARMDGDAK